MLSVSNMPGRILVPVEEAALVEPVFKALAVLGSRLELEIELLHIWEELPFTPPEASYYSQEHLVSYREAAEERAKNVLSSAKALAEKHGLRVHVQLVESGDPAEGIVRVANERGATWIALATHQRRGISRWFLGSVTERVAATAMQPILSVPSH
ncbi:MAG: hypothetical protein RJA70_531 [Pseudomonadota bacterium]